MSLKRTEVDDFVSHHVDNPDVAIVSDISDAQDCKHIQITRVPGEDDYPDIAEYHDVLIRDPINSDGNRPSESPIAGPFDRSDAIQYALSQAAERGLVIVDKIYRYESSCEEM